MNERVFHNDGQPISCPLITMFGASNELPEGKDLEALFDRFLLRFEVGYLLRPSSLRLVLTSPDPVATTTMTMTDLRRAQAEVARVEGQPRDHRRPHHLRDACKAEGIIASDRRWKKSLKLTQAAAFMAGEKSTTPEDLTILTDSLWREPKDRPKVARLVGRLADPVGAQAAEILDAARETAAKVAGLQSGDRKAYIAQAAQALEQFQQQQKKLGQLAKGAGRRATVVIQDANDEIIAIHTELARTVSAGHAAPLVSAEGAVGRPLRPWRRRLETAVVRGLGEAQRVAGRREAEARAQIGDGLHHGSSSGVGSWIPSSSDTFFWSSTRPSARSARRCRRTLSRSSSATLRSSG